ncbi:uncharacterized protein LOC132656532 [Meriones unguiculatus]|uniref:uncharacterized protein LOC132656532 n=1 Tax=Meriones unguiculatus TaxID=10047 RepID=UPI00293E3827|nr:uncharacterized protein LOC132656532 [Meriones unguiculatus]
MDAGRLLRRSRALSPPPPPPLLLEPLPLLEEPPGPQHVSERAGPAAPAPSTHPTPRPPPQPASPRSRASGSRSQSPPRHAPDGGAPTPSTRHPLLPALEQLRTFRSQRLPGTTGRRARPFLPGLLAESGLLRPRRPPAPSGLRSPRHPALSSPPRCAPLPFGAAQPPGPGSPAWRREPRRRGSAEDCGSAGLGV